MLVILPSVAMTGTWWWRVSVFRGTPVQVNRESWEHVKREYPFSEEVEAPQPLPKETLEAIVRANPFSPQRRPLTPERGGGDGASGGGVAEGPEVPPQPQFVYKGRILVGQRPRAIVEDLTAKKTYFLEVGQAVAGFKVLDMTEKQVVLSDPQTHEDVVVSLTPASRQPVQPGAGGKVPGP